MGSMGSTGSMGAMGAIEGDVVDSFKPPPPPQQQQQACVLFFVWMLVSVLFLFWFVCFSHVLKYVVKFFYKSFHIFTKCLQNIFKIFIKTKNIEKQK